MIKLEPYPPIPMHTAFEIVREHASKQAGVLRIALALVLGELANLTRQKPANVEPKDIK